MIIDGLDESEYQGRNELLNVIANYFKTLPHWIRLVVTTRPEVNISEKLQELNPLLLKPNDQENLMDIRLCFKEQLKHVLQSDRQDTILEKLVEKSEGVMLFTYYLIEFIDKNALRMSVDELIKSRLPSDISSVYQNYFKRLKTELQKEVGITEVQFYDFLNALVAAREPLPMDFACKLFLSKEWSSADEQKVRDAIDCISALLPIEGECINFFHKSVKDWLIEKSTSRQKKFTVNERECQRVIAKVCTDELDSLKRKGIPRSGLKQTSRYALQHGVQHILEVEKNARPYCLDDIVKNYVLNIELTYAKLSVRSTATTEDILCVQEKEDINALSKDYRRALETLLLLLRRHVSILSQVPHVIFQTLLNEGGPELSAEALSLLNTRYADLPYMEYLRKKEEGEAVLMRFYASNKVACFDVSPDLRHLVCECRDGTIHLWSLRTAQLLWKRAVQVPKIYVYDPDEYGAYFEAYRKEEWSDPLSFYRSVVFHPTLNLILPGILCQAYTLAGDLKPLFLTSKCRFNLCSISGDKTTMLTDCPNRKKFVTQWSLKDGTEITRFSHEHDILSFAWSPSGRLMAIADSARCIYLIDTLDGLKTLIRADTPTNCSMLKLSPDCRFLFGLCFGRDEMEITEHFLILCLDIQRDTESIYNFDRFPITSHSEYALAFETCNENGFLSGDPFWYSFERSFCDLAAFALVLSKELFIRASPCSGVIEMFRLNEVRMVRGESSDEAEQGTDLGDLTEQRGENNDLTEQKAELAGLPEEEELLDLDDLMEIDDMQERRAENDVFSGQRAEVVDPLEQRAKLDDLPEQRAGRGGLVEHSAKLNNTTEKRDELDDVVGQRTEFNDPKEKNIELNSVEVGVKLVESSVILEIDPCGLSENGADLYDLSEKNSIVSDQHELDLEELYLLADVDQQGPLLEDEENSVVEDENIVNDVHFSVDGDSLYVVMGTIIHGMNLRTGGIFTKRFKGEWATWFGGISLVPVKRGVLFQRRKGRKSLELWNSELSVCIQGWPAFDAYDVVPLSEERIAIKPLSSFSRNLEVTVLDTTSGKIVSIIGNFDGTFLACNSKCEVLTYTYGDSMQLRCENRVLWETSLHPDLQHISGSVIFSPTEEYFIISGKTDSYVFDVVSGKVISQLKDTNVASTKFISNEDCIAGIYFSGHYFLRLYNVKSGDLLSEIVEEREVSSFAACPCKRLVDLSKILTSTEICSFVAEWKRHGQKRLHSADSYGLDWLRFASHSL
ncbi:uncharacterized protein LOC111325967 [Stylophora pistillata]|uniref:uncharacterized protein LOC111325967 n=1 Tax=Stylophora pistillata TaxID=50429 RepID=UPI000C04A01D|nr:uncharacterized protein LOC111325967 [Stylophora pistillata]